MDEWSEPTRDADVLLELAIEEEDSQALREALSQGANPNLPVYGRRRTALYWAVYCRNLELIRALLSAGARVGAEIGADATSLHVAAERGDRDVLELLFAADGSIALDAFDLFHRTPLMRAVEAGQLETARLLLDTGADVNAQDTDNIGDTALHLATERGDAAMVELLLSAGANPRAPGWMGITPLDRAERRAEPLRERLLSLLNDPRLALRGHVCSNRKARREKRGSTRDLRDRKEETC